MPSISSYFSLAYLGLLLPLTIVVYAAAPQKIRRWVLLIFSWLFFWSISGKLIVYLLFSILSVHHIGLWLSMLQEEGDRLLKAADRGERKALKAQCQRKQRMVMTFGACLHIGILLLLKYGPFFVLNINRVFRALGLHVNLTVPSFALPIGISFYTLQAVSYLFDVYRRKIPADKSLFRLALFMSFFPQIMEGPICRYEDTARELWEAEPIRFQNLVFGAERILFGAMKELVLADRLNLLIQNVFTNYDTYDGFVIALSAVCYTLQLYMDFSGTMDIVIGSAQIFGVTLPENFRRPFFSRTISEFWKRWHITLGTWFKDYVFFPLSMSKPLKKLTSRARKRLGNHFGPLLSGSIALFAVWFCNGLWHGAGWHYIFFGMYHFCLILIGNMIEPLVLSVTGKLHISRSSLPYRCFQIVRTAVLVCIGELFFRATGLRAGFAMFRKIFTNFTLATFRDRTLFTFGMDQKDYLIVFIAVLLIFVVGLLQEKGIAIREKLAGKNLAVQFSAYYALVLFIVIFGAYGSGYVPVDPIYAGF